MKIIDNKHIDRKKYSQLLLEFDCTESAMQPWILDAVNPGWGMLSDKGGNYLMPLPIRYKFLLPYITMPVFGQRFDILASNKIDIFPKILRFLKREFLRGDINFNISGLNRRKIKLMQTYQLALNLGYEQLWDAMLDGHKKNIAKANEQISIELSPKSCELLYEMKKTLLDDKNVRFTEFDQKGYIQLIETAVKEHESPLYVAKKDDEEVAAALFVRIGNRFIIDSATSPLGRKTMAMYAIINHFIKTNSSTNSILDFAGSSIPSIAAFRKGFGAQRSDYINVQWRWI